MWLAQKIGKGVWSYYKIKICLLLGKNCHQAHLSGQVASQIWKHTQTQASAWASLWPRENVHRKHFAWWKQCCKWLLNSSLASQGGQVRFSFDSTMIHLMVRELLSQTHLSKSIPIRGYIQVVTREYCKRLTNHVTGSMWKFNYLHKKKPLLVMVLILRHKFSYPKTWRG